MHLTSTILDGKPYIRIPILHDIDNFYNLSLNSILAHIITLKSIFFLFLQHFHFYFCLLMSQFLKGCLSRSYAKQKYSFWKKAKGPYLHYKIILPCIFPQYLLLFHLSFLWKTETEPIHSQNLLNIRHYITHL